MSLLIPAYADRREKAENHLGRYTTTELGDADAVMDEIQDAADEHGYDTTVWAVGEPDEDSLKSWQYHHEAPDAEYVLQRNEPAETDDSDGWVYGEPETLQNVEGYKVRTTEDLRLPQEVHENPTFIDFYVPEDGTSAEPGKVAVRYNSGQKWMFFSKDGEAQGQELVETVMDELEY